MMPYWFKQYFFISLFCTTLTTSIFAFPNSEGIQTYQKNIHQDPDRKQILADDISRYHNAKDIWDILRQEFVLPHYEDDPQVQVQIEWFLQHQNFLLTSTSRAAPYLYYILQQSRKRNLPAEIVLLPIIESSYNPFAYSSAGAAGIWQMMPNTASGYGVKQNWWYDGRRDVIASTKAALDYLTYLGSFFDNNWLLATAAYDTGEGNVLAAINKNIRLGSNTDYWSLPLAQETRIYVPRLLALATIIAHPEKYPIYLPPVRNAPYLAQIDIGTQINLKQAAMLAGISLKNMKRLNSGYSRGMTAPNGPLILPIENVTQFTESLEQSILPQIKQSIFTTAYNETNIYQPVKESSDGNYRIQPGDTIYMTRNGDDLEKIARHFHITTQQLLAANPLDKTNNLLPDERLVIPTHFSHIQIVKINPHQKYQLASGDTIYMVRPGDTIEKIAKRFKSTPPEIRIANMIADNELRTGDSIVIPTHI
jgi:membrane-bound lytic murein transglycosylase D